MSGTSSISKFILALTLSAAAFNSLIKAENASRTDREKPSLVIVDVERRRAIYEG